MSGYIETGYIATVGTMLIYGFSLLRREQLTRRRLTRLGVTVTAAKKKTTRTTDDASTTATTTSITESRDGATPL